MTSSSSAYVDTTILTDALLKWDTARDAALEALQLYTETLLPDYAVREFQAGPLCNYVYAHNCFADKRTLDDVHAKVAALGPNPQRNKFLTALGALSGARLATLVEYERIIEEREMAWMDGERFRLRFIRTHLANKIFDAVAGIDTICTKRTHPLPCLEKVQIEQDGEELRATGKRMDRAKSAECGLTAHLRQQADALTKILEATEEQNAAKPKPELLRRADALRAVLEGGDVPRASCRGLGDAVFAALAPDGSTILTTNEQDHRPLADRVGKLVAAPVRKT